MLPAPPHLPHSRPRATATGIGFATQSPVRVSITKPEERENNRLTGTDRREVVLKANGLFLNSAYAEGAVGNAADYRGPVTPYPATNDTEWNTLAAPIIARTLIEPHDWDASGCFSFFEFQKLLWQYHDVEGDCLAIETNLDSGRPVSRLIPSLMCESPGYSGLMRQDGWIDGVKLGRHHRPLAYHILKDEDTVRLANPTYRAGYVIDNPALIFHFARRISIGGARGGSRFLTSGKDVVDAGMMDSALHRLFDLAAKLNAAITRDKDTAPTVLKPTLPANFTHEEITTEAVEPSTEATDPDNPENVTVRILSEQIQAPGSVIADFSDDPGKRITFSQLSSLLPDTSIVRAGGLERMAMSWRLPVQLLFCIFSGIFNVTGPGFRISLARGSRWREEELRRLYPWVRRVYERHVSWLIQTRQLPAPRKSMLSPLTCGLRIAPDITIDEQRDVRNDMMRLSMGVTSEQELAHLYGRSFPEVVAERAAAINAICNSLPPDRTHYWGGNFAKSQSPDPAANNNNNQQAA